MSTQEYAIPVQPEATIRMPATAPIKGMSGAMAAYGPVIILTVEAGSPTQMAYRRFAMVREGEAPVTEDGAVLLGRVDLTASTLPVYVYEVVANAHQQSGQMDSGSQAGSSGPQTLPEGHSGGEAHG